MRMLLYELFAAVIAGPIIVFTLIIPLLNILLTIANLIGLVLFVVVGGELVWLIKRIINKIEEKEMSND